MQSYLYMICLWIGMLYTGCNPGTDRIKDMEEGPEEELFIDIPRIDFVEMSEVQEHETSEHTIWYDDFSTEKAYMDGYGEIDPDNNFGTVGGSLDAGFDKGDVNGNGNRKVAFGDWPGNGPVMKEGKKFDTIYWRIYVKHEYGWEGQPAKMSRATSIVSENWKQAMIAHVWSGHGTLTLDPARGIYGNTDSVMTTKYNDFDNLYWLGNAPASEFDISSTEESGYWVMVESMARLNTPGELDGLNQLWIDGRLEVERKSLNFRGKYVGHGINAVFLESYWNSGAVKTEGRWFDNFVIATKPIGPVTVPPNPVLHKTPYRNGGTLLDWEVEVAADYNGDDVVFVANELGDQTSVTVSTTTGAFTGSLEGRDVLVSGNTYYTRVRQKDSVVGWSEWSRWHQPFKIE